MKSRNNSSRQRQTKKEVVSSAAIAVVAMSVCINTFAETVPQSTAKPDTTLQMCATAAFRSKNVNVCDDIERKAKPQASTQGSSAPLGSVPSTSPNYGKNFK